MNIVIMNRKIKRGRPIGTTLPDGRYLDEVADLMVANSALKKTPAIAQVARKNFSEHQWPAVERRLQRKWNDSEEKLLQAAEQRVNEERNESTVNLSGGIGPLSPSLITGVFEQFARHRAMFESINAHLRMYNETMEHFPKAIETTALRQLREQVKIKNALLGYASVRTLN